MRVITRTLIILAAALVVVGATMAYASSGLAGGPASFERGRGGFERQPPPGSHAGGRPESGDRRAGFGDHHEGGRGLFAAAEMVKNLVIIAAIIAVVALLSRLTRGLRPRR